LSEFEIESKKSELNKLSQGQKKKVMIAFGLATNTKLLLMDEPTNGLDIPSKGQFRRMVASVAQNDKCIIISTHQVRDLEKLIDSIMIMEQHQIIFNQSTENICKKLVFKESAFISENENPIFAEKSMRGVAQIYENNHNQESTIDIELLFNALLSERTKICQLFEN
jgi:ABC-2 type transport system ATP-binding protein